MPTRLPSLIERCNHLGKEEDIVTRIVDMAVEQRYDGERLPDGEKEMSDM